MDNGLEDARAGPADLDRRARQLVEALGGRWTARGAMVCCPAHADRTPSLSIRIGDYGLLFHCFAGCETGEVLRAIRAIDPHAASSGPRGPYGRGAPGQHLPVLQPPGLVGRLWAEAVPVAGTPGAPYLAARGLWPPREGLRFHAAVPLREGARLAVRPALLAAVREGPRLLALQRSFLDPVAGLARDLASPRRMLGRPGRGLVRLARVGEALGIAEGIETALAAMQILGVPVWAVLGTARFGEVDIPLGVSRLLILADDDAAGRRAARAALAAHAAVGRSIDILWPGGGFNDWNDRLAAGGKGVGRACGRAA